jgi:hypothetical protein
MGIEEAMLFEVECITTAQNEATTDGRGSVENRTKDFKT